VLTEQYLCASMVDGAGFEERLNAASTAGFSGIGLRPTHYKAARAAGLSDADMRAKLDDHGLELIEIGFVADWWETGEKAARSQAYEQTLYQLKEKLGARHLVLISGPITDPVDTLAERFAAVCDRAAEHDLRVGLEFLPWTDMHTLAAAWRIAELSGRDNGGLVYDTWHINRGGTTEAMIRAVPPGRVVAVQISDGSRTSVESELDDTFKRRRLPGDGEFDLAAFIELLESLGVDAPVGVEVLNDELRARPVTESARLGFDATARLLGAAR
jgi:sugar phosphate isomerase/epimerase